MPIVSKQQKTFDKVEAEILQCSFCLKNATGLLVVGEGNANADIVLVGEAPGKQEIVTGRPFIGRAGKLLRELLTQAKLSAEDVFITSAVKYLPKTYITPKPKDIEHGKIHLQKQLAVIKPKVIVILGNTAALSLLDKKFAMVSDHGTFLQQEHYTYFISYHPAAPLYSPKLRPIISKDFIKLKNYLKKHGK